MNALVNSLSNVSNRDAVTANGSVTLASSMNKIVDYFFLAGAMRGKDMTAVWEAAFAEDPELAARVALWARDIRGGAGERQSFRNFLQWAKTRRPDILRRILPKVPELGRWDDLLVLVGTQFEPNIAEMIEAALERKDGLCAKWMPRQGEVAAALRKRLGFSPKGWRKLLVSLTNVVETAMCENRWSDIKFEQVPSRAFSIYRNAFMKHEPNRFASFIQKAEKGEVKINASAIFPHDILYNIWTNENDAASVAQWNNLPNYAEDSNENVLVLADVSGSMGYMEKSNRGPSPMLVSVTLALYTSERLRGAFKDCFMTFEEKPHFVTVRGDIRARATQIKNSPWGGNTNLQAAFDLILNTAIRNKVPAEDMPTKLLIVSDMEFDVATSSSRWDRTSAPTNYEAIRQKYEQSGYAMPQLVFWNVNGRVGNVPVEYNADRVALVSGYNPTVLRNLLAGEVSSPQQFVLDVISNPRYDF